jgi:hypothetical protein
MFFLEYADSKHGGFHPNALFSPSITDHGPWPLVDLNRWLGLTGAAALKGPLEFDTPRNSSTHKGVADNVFDRMTLAGFGSSEAWEHLH